MKKTVALVIAFGMLFCLAACGQTRTVQTEEPESTPGTEIRPDYGELYVVLDGVRFGVMDEADPVTNGLGEPRTKTEMTSCAHQGSDIYWFYDGFELMMNEIDGVNYITGIALKDDLVATQQGVRIGMSIGEAIGLLGDEYENTGSVWVETTATTTEDTGGDQPSSEITPVSSTWDFTVP